MPILNCLGGDKGGTGKSIVCTALANYHIDKKLLISCFDCDRSNPDFYRRYHTDLSVNLIPISEAEALEDAPNTIFNSAIKQDVLVNLPAQVAPALQSWIDNNQLFELAPDVGVQFRMFFVSDGGYDSLKLFRRSLQSFGHDMIHVFVKNWGLTQDWESIMDDPQLQELMAQYHVIIIDFPKFIGRRDLNFIDEHSLSFNAALTHPTLGPISRQRVKTFLKKAYAEFDRAQLFESSTPRQRRKRSKPSSPVESS